MDRRQILKISVNSRIVSLEQTLPLVVMKMWKYYGDIDFIVCSEGDSISNIPTGRKDLAGSDSLIFNAMFCDT